ncbi:response regulator transcription factor [Leptolyngbya sp. 7M]|uniref:response regulator transcription factor n=1 Tax=Leptolyngbya sp. 7M TaxID=2812896 RepID=UPI001CED6BBA|nr:helix-turn-helix transcriptional regulator [Leptolyngbya sp. 7M]
MQSIQSIQPTRPIQASSECRLCNVLGDFYIENYHYLIICPGNQFDPVIGQEFKFPLSRFTDAAVGRVKMRGKECVIVEDGSNQASTADMTASLTGREFQIVQLIAQGHSNKQVAHELKISEWTVSTHLRRVFAKLGVDSRAAMVYRCSALLNSSKY